MTKAEQETIIRWDQEERVLHLYTAFPPEAKKWQGLGYVVEVSDRTRNGEPRSWRAKGPVEALRLRRVEGGQVVARRRGRSFGSERGKLAASKPRKFGGTPSGRVKSVDDLGTQINGS